MSVTSLSKLVFVLSRKPTVFPRRADGGRAAWAGANLGALQGGSGMKGPRCHHEIPATLKFCGECGARLASVCSACGASNAPAQKFCGECGAGLTPGAPAAKFASPESYTPNHLA